MDELAHGEDNEEATAEMPLDDRERQHASTSDLRKAPPADGGTKSDAQGRKPGRPKRRPEDHYLTGPLTSSEKRAFRRLLKLSGLEQQMKRAEELQAARKLEKGKGRDTGERQDGTIWVDGIEIVPSSSRETSPAASEEEGEDQSRNQAGPGITDGEHAAGDADGRDKAITLTGNQQEDKLFLNLADTLLPERDPQWLQIVARGTKLRDGWVNATWNPHRAAY